MTQISQAKARLLLAKQRPMTSLMEKEIIAESDDLVFMKSNRTRLVLDRGHVVTSDCGQMTAHRVATMDGKIMWLVNAADARQSFHAVCSDPFEAMDNAKAHFAQAPAPKASTTWFEKLGEKMTWYFWSRTNYAGF